MDDDEVLIWLYRAVADDPRAGSLEGKTDAEGFMCGVASLEEAGFVEADDHGVKLTPAGIARAEELGAAA